MTKMTPLQEVKNLNEKDFYTEPEIYAALAEAENQLTIETSIDWLLRDKGRLNIWAKDEDKWFGFQEFNLTGIKNLPEYFVKLLDGFKK